MAITKKTPALRVVFWRERGRGCFPDSSVGKQSTYNAGDPDLIPGSGRSAGKGLPTPVFLGFPGGSAGKVSTCNVGDLGSIHGLGRSPGEGKGYPLQHSGLDNSMDYIESDTSGSKITPDGDHSHEIKRPLLLGRKAMTNLDSVLKSRDITLPTKICIWFFQ